LLLSSVPNFAEVKHFAIDYTSSINKEKENEVKYGNLTGDSVENLISQLNASLIGQYP